MNKNDLELAREIVARQFNLKGLGDFGAEVLDGLHDDSVPGAGGRRGYRSGEGADMNLLALREENEVLRERVRQLEAALVPEETRVPVRWRLTRLEKRLYCCLSARKDQVVHVETLMLALYGGRGDDAPNDETLRVKISHLRKKIKRDGWRIRNVYGVGYVLEKEPGR